jgi:hypothetical protein
MRPTTQTREGYPFGDCVRASYATLLGLPLSAVPRFDPAVLGGEDQRDRERRWLRSIGFTLVEISSAPDELPDAFRSVNGPHLISGISPRGFGHRCVGLDGNLIWDPHPSHSGLDKIYSIGLLVPTC